MAPMFVTKLHSTDSMIPVCIPRVMYRGSFMRCWFDSLRIVLFLRRPGRHDEENKGYRSHSRPLLSCQQSGTSHSGSDCTRCMLPILLCGTSTTTCLSGWKCRVTCSAYRTIEEQGYRGRIAVVYAFVSDCQSMSLLNP